MKNEQAAYIGEKLSSSLPWGGVYGGFYNPGFPIWLRSPDGTAAVKAAMVERGYSMHLDYSGENNEWCCDFFFPKKHQGNYGKTEVEAVLAAAETALRAEGGIIVMQYSKNQQNWVEIYGRFNPNKIAHMVGAVPGDFIFFREREGDLVQRLKYTGK